MEVTPANTADLKELCALLTLLFRQEAEFHPDPDAQMRGLAIILAHPELGQILVARREQEVIGMVNLLYTVSTALGGRVAILEDLVVKPLARGAGVGSRLMEHAIQVAKAAGCLRITLLTDRNNYAAQALYRRYSFAFSAMMAMRWHPRP